MTVLTVKEIWQGRDGSGDIQPNGEGVAQITRLFRCVTDNRFDDAETVTQDTRLPNFGQSHPSLVTATVRHKSAQNTPFSATVWIVTIGYSDKHEVTENPLLQPAQIEWNTSQFQTIAVRDAFGRAIVNSAGDPFDPPPMKDDSRWAVSVKKNVASVPFWVLDYRDAVNIDSFQVDNVFIDIGGAKMQSLRIGVESIRNGIVYRVLAFTMHIRGSHRLFLLDQGFREIDDTDDEKRNQILNDDGSVPTSPPLLDGAGKALSNPSLTTAVTFPSDGWEQYPRRAFSVLPLT